MNALGTEPQANQTTSSIEQLVNAPEQFAALDSFRIVAISTIIFYHFDGLLGFKAPMGLQCAGGLVSYFFVLSGFILSHQYQEIENIPQFARYLGARFARIYPACLATLLLTWCLNHHPVFDNSKLVSSFIANLLLLQSWVPDNNYFLCFNAPAWTLSVDGFLYLLLPITIILARKTKAFLAWALTLSTVTAIVATLATGNIIWSQHFFPATRVFDFCLGVAAHKQFKQCHSRTLSMKFFFLSIFLLAIGSYFINSPELQTAALARVAPLSNTCFKAILHFTVIRTALALFFAALIVTLTTTGGKLNMLLSWPPLVRFARISCSLYLVHFPIVVYFKLLPQATNSNFSPVLHCGVFLFIVLSAILMFNLLEVPCRRLINARLDLFFATRYPEAMGKRWALKMNQETRPNISANSKAQKVGFLLLTTTLAALILFCWLKKEIKASLPLDLTSQPQLLQYSSEHKN